MILLSDERQRDVRSKSRCWRCGEGFSYGDRMVPLWISAGSKGRDLLLVSRRDLPAPQNEFIHRHCLDPKHEKIARITPIEHRIKIMSNLPYIEPRGDNSHCLHCKKAYQAGDRLTFVYVCQGVEKDPETGGLAAKISGEFETGHADCHDPKLVNGMSIINR